MKNYSLVEIPIDGVLSWKLIGNDGLAVPAFDMYAEAFRKRNPYNTRRNYCLNLARFLDYLTEAEKYSPQWDQKRLTALIDAYPDWMMLGENSGGEVAREMAKIYPSPKLAKSTAIVAVAAIKMFLELSEKIRQELEELDAAGLGDQNTSFVPLIPGIGAKLKLPGKQIKRLKAKSMLAGVLAGGPKLIRYWSLPIGDSIVPDFDHDSAFPFDKALPLINSFTTSRDKALYALCAASGCRIHEALQVLWEDIDFNKRTVKLVDPHSRPNNPSYLALMPSNRGKLAWKGRSSANTLLLQPFADLFFTHLESYVKTEYVRHGSHQFVFQYTHKDKVGQPFFLADTSSRAATFTLAAGKAGAHGFGAHSLRHMYGTYLVNYFPNLNGGRGLPMEQVQKLMGHSSIESTQKYAKHDEHLLNAALQTLPGQQPSWQGGQSILDIKKEMLEKALSDVNAQIATTQLSLPRTEE